MALVAADCKSQSALGLSLYLLYLYLILSSSLPRSAPAVSLTRAPEPEKGSEAEVSWKQACLRRVRRDDEKRSPEAWGGMGASGGLWNLGAGACGLAQARRWQSQEVPSPPFAGPAD